ncbi:hypothetical protein BSL78_05137 [Apostichopus japonicus]|uniref:Uncharacterized protein n=1 Tax=Stichopus japonicus TaxID=307972 RepID=A0A2G8LCD9_STIJA|nr:hypothetical protein BSL78_05137 [Apostichopus japonicus]
MRPGVSMGSRMANPPLNRSMSMPQSTMNPYQMQNSQNFANFAPNNPNMAIRPTGGGMGGISRQASMPDAMNANMWNGGSTGNVPGPYNTAVATSASSMAANQFGNTGGGMEFQNMMQRGGMPGQMGHSTMGNNPNMAAVNMQPPNQQGGFPGGQGNPQQTASTTTNNSGTSYPTSGSGVTAGMMQQHGGNSELDKMMNFDFNKPDGMMGQNPAMPPQAGIPDTSGNARRMQMNNTQNRVHKEAKARFQKFCKYSDAKEAPDASTRVANLFRNQLIGMAPNLPTNDVGVPSTFLATPGSNQQRVPKKIWTRAVVMVRMTGINTVCYRSCYRLRKGNCILGIGLKHSGGDRIHNHERMERGREITASHPLSGMKRRGGGVFHFVKVTPSNQTKLKKKILLWGQILWNVGGWWIFCIFHIPEVTVS